MKNNVIQWLIIKHFPIINNGRHLKEFLIIFKIKLNRQVDIIADSTTASDEGFVGDRPDDLDDDNRLYDVDKSVVSFEAVIEVIINI